LGLGTGDWGLGIGGSYYPAILHPASRIPHPASCIHVFFIPLNPNKSLT